MSTLVDEYYSTAYPKIEEAITCALGSVVAEEVKKEIQRQTETVVYSYPAHGGLPRRREAGGIKDTGKMESEASGLTLTVKSSVTLQNLFWSGAIGESGKANTAEVVETGAKAYHMPYPRAYHKEAEMKIDGSEEISRIIAKFVNSML